MEDFKNMKRNLYVGATVVALAGTLGIASHVAGKKATVQAAGIVAPKFEVDPMWPKPLPNHWVIGQTIGLDVDSHDNVWIIHRPGTFDGSGKETYGMPNSGIANNAAGNGQPYAICCIAAPDVLEFSPAGELIGHWGKADGHDWPSSNHGITVDKEDNVWLGANGNGQATPAPGAAAAPGAGRGAAPARGAAANPNAAEAGVATGNAAYHDSFILKFTKDGKFLGEIGGANASKGSNDTESVRGVAEIRFNKEGELIAADGYGNKRVSIWDPKTLKIKRFWGAYGKKPDDTNPGAYNPEAPTAQQFRNPVHCAVPSDDGMIYVCDRVNDRVQIFKEDGTFVKEVFVLKNTRGDGSAWEIAFSRDKGQKYLYLADGSNERIHIFDRASMTELTAFGDGGRQPGQFYAVHSIETDSKGNIYTTETYRGQRVQKFVFKGVGAVASDYTGTPWPKK
jgi:hypothetical protein